MCSETRSILEVKCPVCGAQSLTEQQTKHDVDYFGPVLLSTIVCANCGFKHSDVICINAHEPSSISASIEDPEDLKMPVVRSSNATIQIPELGVLITPGPIAEGFISNVEGVLERVEQATRTLLHDPEKRERAERFLQRIKEARDGRIKLTLVIKDPVGNSAIIAKDDGKIKRRKLTKKEIEKLRVRQEASLPNN
jgi:zinc finger protein